MGVGEVPILLDDLIIAMVIGLSLTRLFTQGAVRGSLPIPYTTVSTLFLCLIAYKTIAFLSLSMFLPWTRSVTYEKGVVFTEGVFVLVKLVFLFLSYSFVLLSLRERRDSQKALRVMILCMALVVFYGLVQFFILNHTVVTSTFRNIYKMGFSVPGVWDFADPWFGDATIGHEHLGAFLNITFSLIAGLLFCGYPAKKYQRYSLGLLWACCMFCLVYASSRGAWVGTVCSLAMLFLWFLQQGRIAQLFSYCVYATLGLAVLVYALDLDPIELIGKRIEGLVTVTSGEITDLSAIDRFEVLHLLWNRYLERPLVGWGAGGAGRIAEGQYIRELVEGGIIGGILFMAMLFYCVGIALKHYRRSSDSLIKGSNLGLICGLAGIAGQSLFTELFIVTKVGNPLWVLIAIVQSLGLQEDRTVQ